MATNQHDSNKDENKINSSRFSIGVLIIAFVALFTIVSPFIADWNITHIYNPRWPPHAKFHNAQTMCLGLLLGICSLYFLFRKAYSYDINKIHVNVAILFAILYWIAQSLALLFPGTALVDPEFVKAGNDNFQKLPVQILVDIVVFILLGVAYYLESSHITHLKLMNHKEKHFNKIKTVKTFFAIALSVSFFCSSIAVFAQAKTNKKVAISFYHVTLSSKNTNALSKWYKEKLGFKLLFNVEDRVLGSKVNFLTLDDFKLEILQIRGFKPVKRPSAPNHVQLQGFANISFSVSNLDDAIKQLKSEGVTIVAGPIKFTNGTMGIFINDPEGNTIEFVQLPITK